MFDVFKQFFADKKLKNKRLKICNSCEHKRDKWLALFTEDSCVLCGCSISKKVSLKNTKCPDDRW